MPEPYLEHYGVLGMKWGVRKDRYGPKSSRSSKTIDRKTRTQQRRELKAKRFLDLADERTKQIEDYTSRRNKTNDTLKKTLYDAKISELELDKTANLKEAERIQKGKLSKTQKILLTGTAVVAAYAAYKVLDGGVHHQLIKKGSEFLNGSNLDFKKNFKLADSSLSADAIFENVVKNINPDYGKLGTTNNCRRCTFAYEIARRGYDVKATKTLQATGQSTAGLLKAVNEDSSFKGTLGFIESSGSPWGKNNIFGQIGQINSPAVLLFEGPQIIEETAKKAPEKAKNIFSELAKNPERSRGELGLGWLIGGGHSIAWEIINGSPVVFDTQTRKSYKTPEELEEAIKYAVSAGYTRLDNVDLDMDFLTRWVQNA